MRFLRSPAFLILLVTTGCSTFSQKPPEVLDGIPLVSYCQLVASPQAYLNKEVRLRGVFRSGFEWQQIYSTHCLEAPNTWVEFASDKGCAKTIVRGGPEDDANTEENGQTMGVVFRGRLTGWGSGFGHLGSFASEFQVTCTEETTLIDLTSYYPTSLTPAMIGRIQLFEGKPPH
jgi:hypothetical protein